MVRVGFVVAFALLSTLLLVGPAAWAAPSLPAPPPMPGPPATIGRCLQAGQTFADRTADGVEALRAVGLLALHHQDQETTGLLEDLASMVDHDFANVAPFYVAVLQHTSGYADAVNESSTNFTAVIGPAAGAALSVLGGMAVEWVPAAAATANQSAPWFNQRFQGAVEPVRAWERNTTYSELVNLGEHLTFFTGHTLSVLNAPGPPQGPASVALANNSRDLEGLFNNPGGAGNALLRYTDDVSGTSLALLDSYGQAAGLLTEDQGNIDPVRAARARLTAMQAHLGQDSGLLTESSKVQVGAMQAASAAFAAQVPRCARD